jgi:hypothetical protein
MARVHVTQCLCPKRHCIIALAWEEGEAVPGCGDLVFKDSADACRGVETLIDLFIKDGQINPWCGICKSSTFSYEDGLTRFKSLDEAQPELQKLQLGNLLAMAANDITSSQ